ncbi:MAG: hypothetical protein ACK4MV_14315 [Beijerinckiaceae bacterium]
MRTAAITALGVFLAAGSAWAQSSNDYRDRYDDRGDRYGSQNYGADRYSRSNANDDDDDRHGGWSGNHHRKWDKGHRHGGKYHARGASFYMKQGDKEFRIRCGASDSTRECVGAAMTMFRQVQQSASGASSSPMHSTTTGSSTMTSPSASGAAGSSAASPGASDSPSGR